MKIIIAVVYFVVVGIISIPLWLAGDGVIGVVFTWVTIPVGAFFTLLIGCKNLKWGTLLTKIIDIFASVLTFIMFIIYLFSLSDFMAGYILFDFGFIMITSVSPVMGAVNIVYSAILIKHGNKKLGIVSIIIPLIALGLQCVFSFVPIRGY